MRSFSFLRSTFIIFFCAAMCNPLVGSQLPEEKRQVELEIIFLQLSTAYEHKLAKIFEPVQDMIAEELDLQFSNWEYFFMKKYNQQLKAVIREDVKMIKDLIKELLKEQRTSALAAIMENYVKIQKQKGKNEIKTTLSLLRRGTITAEESKKYLEEELSKLEEIVRRSTRNQVALFIGDWEDNFNPEITFYKDFEKRKRAYFNPTPISAPRYEPSPKSLLIRPVSTPFDMPLPQKHRKPTIKIPATGMKPIEGMEKSLSPERVRDLGPESPMGKPRMPMEKMFLTPKPGVTIPFPNRD